MWSIGKEEDLLTRTRRDRLFNEIYWHLSNDVHRRWMVDGRRGIISSVMFPTWKWILFDRRAIARQALNSKNVTVDLKWNRLFQNIVQIEEKGERRQRMHFRRKMNDTRIHWATKEEESSTESSPDSLPSLNQTSCVEIIRVRMERLQFARVDQRSRGMKGEIIDSHVNKRIQRHGTRSRTWVRSITKNPLERNSIENQRVQQHLRRTSCFFTHPCAVETTCPSWYLVGGGRERLEPVDMVVKGFRGVAFEAFVIVSMVVDVQSANRIR